MNRLSAPAEDRGFAERSAPNVLLWSGVGLVLAAVGAIFTNHQLVATALVMNGLLAIVVAAILGRLEGPITLFGLLSGNLRACEPRGTATADDAVAFSPLGPEAASANDQRDLRDAEPTG
jgi:hypothetical protein